MKEIIFGFNTVDLKNVPSTMVEHYINLQQFTVVKDLTYLHTPGCFFEVQHLNKPIGVMNVGHDGIVFNAMPLVSFEELGTTELDLIKGFTGALIRSLVIESNRSLTSFCRTFKEIFECKRWKMARIVLSGGVGVFVVMGKGSFISNTTKYFYELEDAVAYFCYCLYGKPVELDPLTWSETPYSTVKDRLPPNVYKAMEIWK